MRLLFNEQKTFIKRGYHGLWFDGDLLNGHTQKSKTYDNEPVFNL